MFAIRNRFDPRVFFHLPTRSTGSLRGMTKIEQFKPNKVPRLFARRSHAKSALDNWLHAGWQEGVNVRTAIHWEIIPIKVIEAKEESNDNDKAKG